MPNIYANGLIWGKVEVRPGMYKLVVDAKQPYKDVMLDNLVVRADETLDVGEIVLKQ